MEWQEHIDALPCLNCEGEPVIANVIGAGHRLVCPDCGARSKFHETEASAVDAWNGGPLHRETMEALRLEMTRAS